MDDTTTTASTLLTIAQLIDRYPALTRGGVRHALFFRRSNHLAESGAVLAFGRRILIDPDRWWAWVRAHGSDLTGSTQPAPASGSARGGGRRKARTSAESIKGAA